MFKTVPAVWFHASFYRNTLASVSTTAASFVAADSPVASLPVKSRLHQPLLLLRTDSSSSGYSLRVYRLYCGVLERLPKIIFSALDPVAMLNC
ncbi:hypothetical protein LZ30DRAFT_81839 [Colletotrichum cereale]|nr:hypothetical protein LZ30DRAFT_81839 [Colletotrichum cereale]